MPNDFESHPDIEFGDASHFPEVKPIEVEGKGFFGLAKGVVDYAMSHPEQLLGASGALILVADQLKRRRMGGK